VSRAYRIVVGESLRRHLTASDGITAALELPSILPAERMATLMGAALAARGFAVVDGIASRTDATGLAWRIDLGTGEVALALAEDRRVELHAEAEAEQGNLTRAERAAELREAARADLAAQLDAATDDVRRDASRRLEALLGDARRQLDAAITAAIGAALKERAAQLGRVRSIVEDPVTGALTIKVEV
jgi:FtsH ternary system domain X5